MGCSCSLSALLVAVAFTNSRRVLVITTKGNVSSPARQRPAERGSVRPTGPCNTYPTGLGVPMKVGADMVGGPLVVPLLHRARLAGRAGPGRRAAPVNWWDGLPPLLRRPLQPNGQ